MKYFLQPLFYENNALKGMDVITDVSGGSIKLDRYTSIKDITKAMNTSCFSADGTQSTNQSGTRHLETHNMRNHQLRKLQEANTDTE